MKCDLIPTIIRPATLYLVSSRGNALTRPTLNQIAAIAQPGDTVFASSGRFAAPPPGVWPGYVPIFASGRPRMDSYVIYAATNASPIVCTANNHSYSTGNSVTIVGGIGNTAINGAFTVTVIDANTFSLDGSTGNGSYAANSATTLPTKLLGGTIIHGSFWVGADGFQIHNAGVDAGLATYPAYGPDALAISNVIPNCALTASGSPAGTFTLTLTSILDGTTATTATIAYAAINSTIAAAINAAGITLANFSSTATAVVAGTTGSWTIQPAITMPVLIAVNNGGLSGGTLATVTGHPIGLTPLRGVKVNDVIALGNGPHNGSHAMRLENLDTLEASRVHAVFGDHGIAIKGNDLNVDSIFSIGHYTDAIIVKSDDYAPTARVNLSNVCMRSLGTGTAGLWLQSAEAALTNVNIDNVTWDPGITAPLTLFNSVSMDNIHFGPNCGGAVPASISGTLTNFTFYSSTQSPTLLNSWTNLGSGNSTAGYYREGNTVHIRGTVTGGTNGTIMFDLPAGFIPTSICRFAGITASGGGLTNNAADIAITDTGAVYMESNYAGQWAAFEGSFSVQ